MAQPLHVLGAGACPYAAYAVAAGAFITASGLHEIERSRAVSTVSFVDLNFACHEWPPEPYTAWSNRA